MVFHIWRHDRHEPAIRLDVGDSLDITDADANIKLLVVQMGPNDVSLRFVSNGPSLPVASPLLVASHRPVRLRD